MKSRTLGILILILMISCKQEISCHDGMILILEKVSKEPYNHRNQLYPQAKIPYMDSLLVITRGIPNETNLCKCFKAHMLMELGQKEEAIKILEGVPKDDRAKIMRKEIV